MRGRVMGLYGLIFRGAPAVGALGAGFASSYFGLIAVCGWLYRDHQRTAEALKSPDAEINM